MPLKNLENDLPNKTFKIDVQGRVVRYVHKQVNNYLLGAIYLLVYGRYI